VVVDHCEIYFEVYSISKTLKPGLPHWILEDRCYLVTICRFAWLFHILACSCDAVCSYFDRDQYQLCMKQLDKLTSVTEYFEQFEQLAHQILLYNSSYDDVYFVSSFFGGLKEEIHSPISLNHPPISLYINFSGEVHILWLYIHFISSVHILTTRPFAGWIKEMYLLDYRIIIIWW